MKIFSIIDLEWTSWKGNYYGKFLEKEKRLRWQKKEIIQIGAIKFDKNFRILDKLNLLVKPKINTKLSKHIIKLTRITNNLIEKKSLEFTVAYKILKRFLGKTKTFSNGKDGLILKKNLEYNKSNLSALMIHDIKKTLEKKYKIPKNYLHSPKLKTYYGYLYNPKIAHNALHDCKSILYTLKKINFNLD